MRRCLLLALALTLSAAHAAGFLTKGAEQLVTGELIEADFIHRSGVLRTEGTGVLVEFTLPPCATISYLNTDADLRDVPLGTRGVFSVMPGGAVAFIKAGAATDEAATERQRQKHKAFLKDRGLPALIEKVEGKTMTLTLIGDPVSLAALCKDEDFDPARWAAEKRRIGIAVANEELRTYNPPVDQQGTTVLTFQNVPADSFGCSGIRWVVQPNLLLEGFRKGHVVRLFKEGWPVKDMAYGESVYPEIFNAETVETDPDHYPFRTDFANGNLPWYQLQPGVYPPHDAAHVIGGELVKVDADGRGGEFRTDRTGQPVTFTLPPFAAVMRHNAGADLADIAIGTRCLFALHQDGQGAFTVASRITDEFTHSVAWRNTFRLDTITPGKLLVATQLPEVKDERDILFQPPDLGVRELLVDARTRVWKGSREVKLTDLAPGDKLLINRTARTAISQGTCTDIWAGLDAHKFATEQQRATQQAALQKHGLPAWIESIEGRQVTITLFAASRAEFTAIHHDDPKGRTVYVRLGNDKLQPGNEAATEMRVLTSLPEGNTAGTDGCSGVRWLLEPKELPAGYSKGRVVRILEQAPPVPDAPK